MKGENGTPVTPDWAPQPKPWDPAACCPTGTCKTAQHAIYMHRLADLALDGIGDN